jgi:ABC-type uncharacterized transport system permease subunit
MNKHLAFFNLELRQWLEFKVDFYLFWLESLFKAIVMGVFWWQIWETSGTRFSDIERDTFFCLLIFTQVMHLPFRGSETIAQMIEVPVVSGKMALVLCRPVNPLWMNLARVLCRQGRLMICCLILLGIVQLWLLPEIGIDSTKSSLMSLKVVIALIQGLLINYLLFSFLGILSFWVGDIWSLIYAISIFAGFFSGQFFPLHLQGDLEWISRWLPFRYTAYSPACIAVGQESWGELLRQSVALACLLWATSKAYKAGVKKFEASGG